ncbi:MAG: ABC transporter substrate-binding protein [Candidatus Omnitrophica bacterium]|nr:ABC transporter substrate-binding protein [Candidatus Omnitrophota bacterium]MDD5575030.1 ABC transporter substrate-binding protein [Candidatus Omnitrophota bacterium]
MKKILISSLTLFAALSVASCVKSPKQKIRVGYFPNVTHSQVLIGMARGVFQEALGPDVQLEVKTFNAGPSVIEAMFAGALDMAYIGPNPAINGYIKSRGEAFRIVAGATSGGAALVVQADGGIASPEDFHKKRIASPQLGNTQDVALRAWLKNQGLVLQENGGDVQVVSIANPDQLTLFLKREIDGAWTVEPWVSRLIKEGRGRVYLEESALWPRGEFVTAHIIVSKAFLERHPGLVKKWLSAHVDLTLWINEYPAQARVVVNQAIRGITGEALSEDILEEAFSRLRITYDPIKNSLLTSARWAFEQGFLGKENPDLSGIYDLEVLQEVLREKGLPAVD